MDITNIIGGINSRLKRLEETIGEVTDVLLQFASFQEKTTFTDTVMIYSRDVNDSFLFGTGTFGVTKVGDRRSQAVLLYSGGGS